jgi:excisionase family DNA binding protein
VSAAVWRRGERSCGWDRTTSCPHAQARPGVDEPPIVDQAAAAVIGVAPVPLLPLYTPTEAARLLSVRESWLRRRVTARLVPCTFLGRQLRFSHADVIAVAAAAARPSDAAPAGGRARRTPRQTGQR